MGGHKFAFVYAMKFVAICYIEIDSQSSGVSEVLKLGHTYMVNMFLFANNFP